MKSKIPDHPWTKCAADLVTCRLQGLYLLIADYYSKFITLENLEKPQSETVINKCKFSHNLTYPKSSLQTMAPEFSSHQFCLFSTTWGILHKISSPYYHQTNC